jgi:hypothetical protein
MEHINEILKVWADLHNKPSKLPKERQLMNELASILPRYGGGPVMQKMKVVRAGGTLEFAAPEILAEFDKAWGGQNKKEGTKRVAGKILSEATKAGEHSPRITGFTDALENAVNLQDREEEIVSFVDSQEEKKSPQSNADPVNVAEVKRGRKAKVKE